jgi:hypothetical protein
MGSENVRFVSEVYESGAGLTCAWQYPSRFFSCLFRSSHRDAPGEGERQWEELQVGREQGVCWQKWLEVSSESKGKQLEATQKWLEVTWKWLEVTWKQSAVGCWKQPELGCSHKKQPEAIGTRLRLAAGSDQK